MALSDKYIYSPTAREPAPVASTEFDGENGHLQTRPLTTTPENWDEILRDAGYDPEEVEVVGNPRISRWEAGAPGNWLTAYKLTLRRKGAGVSPRDLEAELRNTPIPAKYPERPGAWFHVQFGDLHIGKGAEHGGGIELILSQYAHSLGRARAELDSIAPDAAGICISFVGDLIDGHTSQNGRLIAGQDLSLTEQIRVGRRAMLKAVDTFLDTGLPIRVMAIGGNHDETTRVQSMKPGDNHATEAAIALADALALSPAHEHVTVTVPPPTQGHMTVDVGGTRVTYVHGHRFGGGSVEKKISDWWAGQAVHGRPAGSSNLLCAGHYHSFRNMQISADKVAIMSPSLEVESSWFAETTGARSKRGAVTYITNNGEVTRVSVL